MENLENKQAEKIKEIIEDVDIELLFTDIKDRRFLWLRLD